MALTKFNFNSFDVTSAASAGLGFNASANGFSTINPGAMTLIKTLTASSSSTLSFVDGSSDVVLDNTYPIYKFQFINMHPATNDTQFSFQGSTNTGSSYGVNITSTAWYATESEAGGNTALSYYAGLDLVQSTNFQPITEDIGNDNDQSASGSMYLFNPSSTTFVKHFMTDFQHTQRTDYSYHFFTAGYLNTTSTIDAIQFKMLSGNTDAGTIKLYGIKDS